MLVIIACLTSASISGEKIYLSIEERSRTLSLPRKTWKINVGAEFGFGQTDGSFDFEFDPGLINLQFPYMPLGNRGELHFFTPRLKLYPVKNAAIQDSFSVIDGPNFALLGGITGLWYSTQYGFNMTYGGGYQFKTFLTDKSWLFSNAIGFLDLDFDWSSNLTIGAGFQISDRFSIMISLRGSVYEYIVHFVDTGIEESYIGYTAKIPIDFKFNKNRKSGFLYRTGFKYMSNTFDNSSTWLILLGFQKSWHW
jgi:hypothetical protein